MKCLKCTNYCDRVSVHNGIGMMYGPWGCPCCGWSEMKEYDLNEGQSPVTKDGIIDQFGMLTPINIPLVNKESKKVELIEHNRFDGTKRKTKWKQ